MRYEEIYNFHTFLSSLYVCIPGSVPKVLSHIIGMGFADDDENAEDEAQDKDIVWGEETIQKEFKWIEVFAAARWARVSIPFYSIFIDLISILIR